MRTFPLAVAAVLTGCLALAGCGKEAAVPAAPATSSVRMTEAPSQAPSTATTAASSVPAGTPAPTTSTSGDASDPATATNRPATSLAVVNASDYLAQGGIGRAHYFTSGALRCGIGKLMVGCQSTAAVANRPKCNDPATKAPYVVEDHTEPPADGCTNQGVFIVEKARELPAGRRLVVGEVSCEARSVGSVVCTTPTATITANSKVFDYTVR